MTSENPLKPIRGPFDVRGGGGTLTAEVLPEGLVRLEITAETRTGPVYAGSITLSSLNWAHLLSLMAEPEPPSRPEQLGELWDPAE